MLKYLLSCAVLLLINSYGFAQKSYYTQIQGGANIGLSIPNYKGQFNGYSLHFIFGRNLDEKAFVGIGLGNETLKGDYQKVDSSNEDGRTLKYDRNLFPIFLDGRFPIKDFGEVSRIGVLGNVGFAPSIGPVYDKGMLAKAGLFYLHDSISRTKFTVSASYVYQQLKGNIYSTAFNHQHINLSVGIMLK